MRSEHSRVRLAGRARRRRRDALMVGGLASMLVLAACTSGSPSGAAEPTPSPTGLARTIAVLAPLTGPKADDGRGVLQSVQGVVAERAADLTKAGLDVTVLALDDRGEPSVGQQQATRLPDDPTVVAVVGSVTSLVDEGVQPILNTAGLAMIAPGGGAPWLTARGRPPVRPFDTYFRLCAQDRDLGTAAAIRALERGDRRAVVIDDGTIDHTAVASAFVDRFSAQPGSTVTRVVVGSSLTKPLSARELARIDAFDPQTVLVSTTAERLPSIRESLTVAGTRPSYVTVLPPADSTSVTDDAEAWTGVVAATVGALPQTLPGRPTLVPTTPGDQPLVEPGLFGAAAADAATLVVDALIAGSTPSSDGAATGAGTIETERAQVVARVGAARIAGATGPVSFDSYGNVRSRPVGFFAFDDTEWVPQPAVVVGPAP